MRFIFVVALILSSASLALAQRGIVEVKHNAPAAEAPRECLSAFRGFFQFLQKGNDGIVKDKEAQKRWLSRELRRVFAEKLATFTDRADNPDYPSNNTFIGAWERPSTYAIVSSRRYGKTAVVDVLYKWGAGKNYENDERTSSFIFVLEDGALKLDDIYTFRGKFVTAESLSQYLREKE